MSKEHLEAIISQRHTHISRIDQSINSLKLVRKNLKELKKVGVPDAPVPLNLPEDWYEQAITLIEKGESLSDRLKARFSKKTINIGVAGRARQGKSTLLKTLTGLDDNMIPTSNGTQNTGTRSTFYFTDEVPGAEVEFYTPEEFMEQLVGEYYRALGCEDRTPETLQDFEDVSDFEDLEVTGPKNVAILKKLIKIHSDLDDFSSSLGRPSLRIRMDEIVDYVSQVDGRKNFLAVKNVKVFINSTQVNRDDLEGLGVIDLPGLGEIALGHDRKLIESMRHEVDVILIVKKPNSDGDLWEAEDIDLISLLQDTIPEVDFHHWLYMLLNKQRDGSNETIIRELLHEDQKGQMPKELEILICNCIDQKDVQAVIFDQVLSQMKASLQAIDQSFLVKLNELWAELDSLLKPFNHLSPTHLSKKQDVKKNLKFHVNFENTFKDMQGTMNRLYRQLSQQADGEIGSDYLFQDDAGNVIDKDFDSYVTSLEIELEHAHEIPSVDVLSTRELQGGLRGSVIEGELQRLRAQLSMSISNKIDVYLRSFFRNKFNVLMHEFIPQSFKNIIWKIAGVDPNSEEDIQSIFAKFRNELCNDPNADIIVDGFKIISDSKFEYYTLFHHFVRMQMKALDPINHPSLGAKIIEDAVINLPNDEKIERVAFALQEQYIATLMDVCSALKSLRFTPYRALFAIMEQFKDQIIDVNQSNERSSKHQWRELFENNSEIAWPDDFGNQMMRDNELQNRRFEVAHEIISTIATQR